jgi:hypothetical protein
VRRPGEFAAELHKLGRRLARDADEEMLAEVAREAREVRDAVAERKRERSRVEPAEQPVEPGLKEDPAPSGLRTKPL